MLWWQIKDILQTKKMTTYYSSISYIIENPKKKELMVLTPIETERINRIDDDWINTGMPEKIRYLWMGNLLVVGLVEKMEKRLD